MATMLLMASWRTCSNVSRMTSRVDDDVNFQARTLSGGRRTSCSMMLPPTGHSTNYVDVHIHHATMIRLIQTQYFFLFFWLNNLLMYILSLYACPSGAIRSVAVRAAWLRWSASLGSRPGLAGSLCQVIAAYALRLNSPAGTEGSTVSSLICDRWLVLGSEKPSISRCLNHW